MVNRIFVSPHALILIASPYLLCSSAFAENKITSLLSTIGQCQVPIPKTESDQIPLSQKQIIIEAGQAQAKMGDQASFSGGVALTQGDRQLTAEQAVVDQKTDTLTADGAISYRDNTITVESEHLKADLKSRRASLANAQYQLHGVQGRGEASNLRITEAEQLSLDNAVYTGCPEGDSSWSITAESITVDQQEDWAEARNAVLRVLDVPVFYLPYFSYPISDKRRSGFLFPSVGNSSTDGADISIPYYWNIAPAYDATITPRLMTKRGLQLQNEFRYLGTDQEGQFNIDYLPDDELADDSRWLTYWQHDGTYSQHWQFAADYTRVSDDSYLSDLGSSIASSSETELVQRGQVSYHQKNWYSGLIVNDFQILDDSEEAPHQLLPQLYFAGNWVTGRSGLEFGLKSEYSNFSHEDDDLYTAQRYYVEPSFLLPLRLPYGFIDTEIALKYTQYHQEVGSYTEYAEHVTRSLPMTRVYVGVDLERNHHWLGKPFRQTLEPRLQYLYVPYQDQSEIAIYDTDELQQDYHGLFRDVRYSGLDRIADANQFTLGVTSRFFDENEIEKLRFAIGQRFDIEESRVTLDDDDSDELTTVFAAEVDANIRDVWFYHTGVQYDTADDRLAKANSALEWRPTAQSRMVQLNYRYAYATESMVSDINQLGLKSSWPINPTLDFVGSYYRDIDTDRTVDLFAGLRFKACCWSIELSVQKQLITKYLSDDTLSDSGTYDDSIQLQFEVKGIGGTNTNQNDEMLNSGSFTYGRPFYLND